MNIHFTLLIIVLSWFAAALFLLFLGGILVRGDLHRAAAAADGVTRLRSRILEDLRGLQETVVEFVAVSEPCRRLLGRLAPHEKPVGLRTLLKFAGGDEHHRAAAFAASAHLWTALFIIVVTGLVHFGRRGFRLTPTGREFLRSQFYFAHNNVDTAWNHHDVGHMVT